MKKSPGSEATPYARFARPDRRTLEKEGSAEGDWSSLRIFARVVSLWTDSHRLAESGEPALGRVLNSALMIGEDHEPVAPCDGSYFTYCYRNGLSYYLLDWA